jgi:hypothetical protein
MELFENTGVGNLGLDTLFMSHGLDGVQRIINC